MTEQPTTNDPADPAPADGAVVVTQHRDHRFPARGRRIPVRLDDTELAAIELAAGRAGLTPTGYVGAVALAAARGTVPPAPSQTRQALAELMAARTQLRRFETNVNQAVAALNATGESPEWLAQAVELTARAVRRVDEAAAVLMRRRGEPAVIGKICPRGRRVGGLIRYLYATGPAQQEGRRRRNPPLDPRRVGGFDDPAELEVDDRGASQEVIRRGSGWPKQVARKHRGPSVLPAGSRKCQGTRGPARWRTRNLPGGGHPICPSAATGLRQFVCAHLLNGRRHGGVWAAPGR